MAKLLILDDEKLVGDMLEARFLLEGYEVYSVTSPQKALELMRQHGIQLVISDIMMPEMNGVEFLRKAKELDGLAQFIMITGYVTMENIVSVFSLGANNVFFKPFETMENIVHEVALAEQKLKRIREVLRERAGMVGLERVGT